VTNGGNEENGGAVFVSPIAALIVEDSTITENTAAYGGGIYGEYLAQIDVVGSTIEENVAENEGGGIFGEDGSYVSVKESKITKNRAHYDGGGIASDPPRFPRRHRDGGRGGRSYPGYRFLRVRRCC
jgi:predicted outer membrane repeat protein